MSEVRWEIYIYNMVLNFSYSVIYLLNMIKIDGNLTKF